MTWVDKAWAFSWGFGSAVAAVGVMFAAIGAIHTAIVAVMLRTGPAPETARDKYDFEWLAWMLTFAACMLVGFGVVAGMIEVSTAERAHAAGGR